MKAKRKPASKAKRAPRRMSRQVLEKMLADLKQHLDRQVWTVEAIMKVVAPTGQTLVAAFPVQKVTELALSEHLREMRQIQVLARQMCGPAVQSSTVASPWLQRLAAYEGLAGERRA